MSQKHKSLKSDIYRKKIRNVYLLGMLVFSLFSVWYGSFVFKPSSDLYELKWRLLLLGVALALAMQFQRSVSLLQKHTDEMLYLNSHTKGLYRFFLNKKMWVMRFLTYSWLILLSAWSMQPDLGAFDGAHLTGRMLLKSFLHLDLFKWMMSMAFGLSSVFSLLMLIRYFMRFLRRKLFQLSEQMIQHYYREKNTESEPKSSNRYLFEWQKYRLMKCYRDFLLLLSSMILVSVFICMGNNITFYGLNAVGAIKVCFSIWILWRLLSYRQIEGMKKQFQGAVVYSHYAGQVKIFLYLASVVFIWLCCPENIQEGLIFYPETILLLHSICALCVIVCRMLQLTQERCLRHDQMVTVYYESCKDQNVQRFGCENTA